MEMCGAAAFGLSRRKCRKKGGTMELRNTVVIVTYNRKQLLKECISHVLAQTVPFAEIVIIDNHSTDGTEEELRAYARDPRFVIRRMDENLGGAGGFAAGMEMVRDGAKKASATGRVGAAESASAAENVGSLVAAQSAGTPFVPDYVLVIDDDAMIAPDYMERICTYGEAHPEVNGFAGRVEVDGKIDPYHRRRLASKILFYESMLPEADYGMKRAAGARIETGRADSKDASTVSFCDCATFCGFVLRGKTLMEIGLPKAEYFLWYDDTEYTLRLFNRGHIAVLGGAVLDHRTVLAQETKSLLERITWRQYYGYRNRHDTARIHAGALSALCVRLQYQVFRAASLLMMLSRNPERAQQGRYNVKLLTDVLRDCRSGRLGKHQEYGPWAHSPK